MSLIDWHIDRAEPTSCHKHDENLYVALYIERSGIGECDNPSSCSGSLACRDPVVVIDVLAFLQWPWVCQSDGVITSRLHSWINLKHVSHSFTTMSVITLSGALRLFVCARAVSTAPPPRLRRLGRMLVLSRVSVTSTVMLRLWVEMGTNTGLTSKYFCSLRSSKHLHDSVSVVFQVSMKCSSSIVQMLHSVMRAPLSFFETTPTGRCVRSVNWNGFIEIEQSLVAVF
jgi:hypothetical protein